MVGRQAAAGTIRAWGLGTTTAQGYKVAAWAGCQWEWHQLRRVTPALGNAPGVVGLGAPGPAPLQPHQHLLVLLQLQPTGRA